MQTLSEQLKVHSIPKIMNGHYNLCCYKIAGKPTVSWQDAAVYVKLREQNCNKREALTFAQKKRCRIDTTITRLGPAKGRIIKFREGLVQQVQSYLQHKSNNGWSNSLTVEYELGQPMQKFKDTHESMIHQKLDESIERKVKDLTLYQNQTKHTYNLSKLTRQQLLLKLKKLNVTQDQTVIKQEKPINDSEPLRESQVSEILKTNSPKQNSFKIQLKSLVNSISRNSDFITQASDSYDDSNLNSLMRTRSELRSKVSKRIRTYF